MKSDNYARHSLFRGSTEPVVQSLQYNINTHTPALPCGHNINASFSVSFFDIGPHEEVLVSCGLSMQGLSDVYSSVIVLRQCKLNVMLFIFHGRHVSYY